MNSVSCVIHQGAQKALVECTKIRKERGEAEVRSPLKQRQLCLPPRASRNNRASRLGTLRDSDGQWEVLKFGRKEGVTWYRRQQYWRRSKRQTHRDSFSSSAAWMAPAAWATLSASVSLCSATAASAAAASSAYAAPAQAASIRRSSAPAKCAREDETNRFRPTQTQSANSGMYTWSFSLMFCRTASVLRHFRLETLPQTLLHCSSVLESNRP